jgi:hypothetical protein
MSIETIATFFITSISTAWALWLTIIILANFVSEISARVFVPDLIASVVVCPLHSLLGWEVGNRIVVVSHSLVPIRAHTSIDIVRPGLVSGSGGPKCINGNLAIRLDLFHNVYTSKCSEGTTKGMPSDEYASVRVILI